MIIEYRCESGFAENPPHARSSRVKRTYKDVTDMETTRSGVTYLTGIIPAEMDMKEPEYPKFVRYAQTYVIAAINLAPGEYLERVDLPRD